MLMAPSCDSCGKNVKSYRAISEGCDLAHIAHKRIGSYGLAEHSPSPWHRAACRLQRQPTGRPRNNDAEPPIDHDELRRACLRDRRARRRLFERSRRSPDGHLEDRGRWGIRGLGGLFGGRRALGAGPAALRQRSPRRPCLRARAVCHLRRAGGAAQRNHAHGEHALRLCRHLRLRKWLQPGWRRNSHLPNERCLERQRSHLRLRSSRQQLRKLRRRLPG